MQECLGLVHVDSLAHNHEFSKPGERKLLTNIVGKGRKCWLLAFSLFPIRFSTLSQPNLIIIATI